MRKPSPSTKEEAGKSEPKQDISGLLPMPPTDDLDEPVELDVEAVALEPEPLEKLPESPKPVALEVGSRVIPSSLVSQRIAFFEPGEDAPSISPFVLNRKDFSAATSVGKNWQETVTENSDAAKNEEKFVDLTWNRTLEARRNGKPLSFPALPSLDLLSAEDAAKANRIRKKVSEHA
jgi:hypothetical protein